MSVPEQQAGAASLRPPSATANGVRHRVVALAALVVFVVLSGGSAPYLAGLFPSADMGQLEDAASYGSRLWDAVQLYAVLCASALFPALLWTVWLRPFGGSLATSGLGANRAKVIRTWTLGALAGAALIAVLCLLLAGAGWYSVSFGGLQVSLLLTVMSGLALAALYEELLFRGFGYWAMSQIGGHGLAIVVSSILFAMAHGDNSGSHWLGLVNTALAGALLAVLRWRSGNLWAAWGVHLGWNAALGLLFGAKTSGFAFAGRLWESEATASGARHLALAGGPYGPEGSALLTPMLVLWIVWLVRRPAPSSGRG